MAQKGLKIPIIFPWEIGLVIFIIGCILIYVGNRQSKKKDFDFDNMPLFKPTAKILFGTCLILIGSIQLIPLLSN